MLQSVQLCVERLGSERVHGRRLLFLQYYIVMSSFAQHGNDSEEIQPPQRPPSPPPHTTFAVRGVHVRFVSRQLSRVIAVTGGLSRRHRPSPLFDLVMFVSRLRRPSHTSLGAAMGRN
jgi:hypothetical protein